MRRLDPHERTLCLIDSLPVPVVGCAHARGRQRGDGAAAYGHNAAKTLTDLFGVRQVIVSCGAIIVVSGAMVLVLIRATPTSRIAGNPTNAGG